MRITQKDLRAKIDRLNNWLGFESNTTNALQLDCAYGGYRVVQLTSDKGSCRDLSDRDTARELYEFLCGMEATLDVINRAKSLPYFANPLEK